MSSQNTLDRFSKHIIEELDEGQARELLKEFARSKFYNLPFRFMQKIKIIERKCIICHQWINNLWHVTEQTSVIDKGKVSPKIYKGNYVNRLRIAPDKFCQLAVYYVIPNSEFEESCCECFGHGKRNCGVCNGIGEKRCYNCLGKGSVEIEERCSNPLCDNGIVITTSTKTCRGMDGDIIGRQEIENKTTCDICRGRGYLTYEDGCSTCEGSGRTYCIECDGIGKIKCSNCGGKGKVIRVKIAAINWVPKGQSKVRLYKGDVPEEYLEEYFKGMRGEKVFWDTRPMPDNVFDAEQLQIYRIRTEYVKYKLGDKPFVIYRVAGKLKFDDYPRNFKWLG